MIKLLAGKGLKFKIMFGVIVGCTITFVMGVFIYLNILSIKKHQVELINAEKAISSVKKLQLQITDMESGIRAYLLGGRSEDLEPFSKTEGLFDKQIETSKIAVGTKRVDLHEKLDEILKTKAKWLEIAAVGEMLGRRKLGAGFIDFKQFSQIIIESDGNRLIKSLKGKINKIVIEYDKEIIQSRKSISKLMQNILNIVLIGTFFTIIVSFLIQYVITASTSKNFYSITDSLSRSSVRLNQVSNDSRDNSSKLSKECLGLNKGLEANSSTLEEMRTMISKTSESSSEGQELLKKLRRSIDDIAESNKVIEDTITQNYAEIKKSLKMVEKIETDTKLINDIVFQTKLLSINASIEASKAGEHGKGFSVIAEEIGLLAKVSGESSIKIETIVYDTKKELDQIMSKSISMVDDLFEKNKAKLETGESSLKDCFGRFTQINSAIDEQATGVEEVNRSAGDFEKSSKVCSSVADMNSTSADNLKNEVNYLDKEIKSIKKVIFGKYVMEKNGALKKRKIGKLISIFKKEKDGNQEKNAA